MTNLAPLKSPISRFIPAERLPKQSTGKLILSYAVDFLDHHSEAELRIKDICRDTNVTSSSIYRLFGSPEGLVVAAEVERYAKSFGGFIDEIEPAIKAITNRREFREFMLRFFHESLHSERAALRLQRVNAVGAMMGHPVLMTNIAAIEEEMITRAAEMLRLPRERGWIRPDIDLKALGAWLMGHSLGRVPSELGSSSVSDEAWNQIAGLAFVAIVFGDESMAAEDRLTA